MRLRKKVEETRGIQDLAEKIDDTLHLNDESDQELSGNETPLQHDVLFGPQVNRGMLGIPRKQLLEIQPFCMFSWNESLKRMMENHLNLIYRYCRKKSISCKKSYKKTSSSQASNSILTAVRRNLMN